MRILLLFPIYVCLQAIAASFLFAATTNKLPEPSDAKALGKELMSNFPGIFSLDNENRENIGEYEIPAIRNGNWMLATHPISLVESFTQDTQAIATIFVKVEDEFMRLSTTEANEKPGTILSHSHPAYKRLLGELRYTGIINLSGNKYMADYDVFRDRQGRVIGAYLVGIPIES
jgi:methyl-accepting chemotaxis protein